MVDVCCVEWVTQLKFFDVQNKQIFNELKKMNVGLWSKSKDWIDEVAKRVPWLLFLEVGYPPAALFDGSPFCGNPEKGFVMNNFDETTSTNVIKQCKNNVFGKNFDKCCWKCGQGMYGVEDVWKALVSTFVFNCNVFWGGFVAASR